VGKKCDALKLIGTDLYLVDRDNENTLGGVN
jgi:hypothetical protein